MNRFGSMLHSESVIVLMLHSEWRKAETIKFWVPSYSSTQEDFENLCLIALSCQNSELWPSIHVISNWLHAIDFSWWLKVAILFPLVSYTNGTCGLFLHHFIWELRWLLLLACTFCHKENVFIPTALYIIHLLKKLCCHSVSLGKLYKWNVWTVPQLLLILEH